MFLSFVSNGSLSHLKAKFQRSYKIKLAMYSSWMIFFLSYYLFECWLSQWYQYWSLLLFETFEIIVFSVRVLFSKFIVCLLSSGDLSRLFNRSSFNSKFSVLNWKSFDFHQWHLFPSQIKLSKIELPRKQNYHFVSLFGFNLHTMPD